MKIFISLIAVFILPLAAQAADVELPSGRRPLTLAYIQASDSAVYKNSLGFIEEPRESPTNSTGLTSLDWFKDPVELYDSPKGKLIGTVFLHCGPGSNNQCQENEFHFKPINGSAFSVKPALAANSCYTDQVLIFETQDDWYLTSLGWLKLPEHGQYQTWRAHFKHDLSAYPYPYTSLIDQPLLVNPFAEWGAERSFKNIDHPDQVLTTKGQQIHILATKGDWALVAITKRDGFYCSDAAIRGDIGWIRIITEQGMPLLSQVYSCC